MTTTSLLARCSSLLAALTLASALAAQTSVTMPCVLDNTLYESPTGALSNGKGPSIFCGVTGNGDIRRALMKFDVAANVPAGAKILSASINLNVVQSTVALPTPATGHRVTQAWGEGNSIAFGGGGGGAPAQNNDATWVHTFRPGSLWTSVGGDFVATPSFTMALPALGAGSSVASLEAATDVQTWLDTPAQNFGWLLKLDEVLSSTARRISSREATSGQPTLTVTYLLPGQVGTVGVGCPVGAGTFQDAFVGVPTGGTTIQILQTNAPASSLGGNFFTLGVEPVGFPLLPGCSVYLALSQGLVTGNVFATDASGVAVSPFALPSGFPGFLITTQALVLDNSVLGFALSNAAVLVLQ